MRDDLFLYNCLQGFAASVDAHSAGIRAAFEAVRVRLGEMADFLQRLLSDGGDGLLNASALSNCSGVMEMLQRSLEESRRMSQSLLLHEHTGTNCIKIGLPGKLILSKVVSTSISLVIDQLSTMRANFDQLNRLNRLWSAL